MTGVLLATGNPHKLDEVRPILSPLGIRVDGLDSLAEIPPEPVEDGATFEENARIKATEYARATGRIRAREAGVTGHYRTRVVDDDECGPMVQP